MDNIVGLVAVILIFGMPIIIVVAALITKYKTAKRRYEAVVKAIELGKDPEEIKSLFPTEKKKKRDALSYFRAGVIIVAIGFGLLAMGQISAGVFLLILGGAFFVLYLFQKQQQ
ncbi:hypothetical protein DRP53_01805 [candidate division WOR-3 bacterium]|uniref:DUF6249 domain-containing protein n=1 Tax=candidate division WOR-3 bacterium TaxID=2052148 RepID=A0A660SMQ2_UNCW3|nr:MAG: hypothetical protein DRP53_01805 [candidate division WOR-3 bacterium]